MRRIILVLWLLIPIAGVAYHFGPGQKLMTLDDVEREVATARDHVERARELAESEGDDAARAEWEKAEEAFGRAIDQLPGDRKNEVRKLRLERAKAWMHVSKLPEANAELKELIDDLVADEQGDEVVLADARDAWANSQFYITWLMRLEGHPREVWEPEIDAARQTYKLLAQSHEKAGRKDAFAKTKENLEASILLARREIDELQGLPIPSQ